MWTTLQNAVCWIAAIIKFVIIFNVRNFRYLFFAKTGREPWWKQTFLSCVKSFMPKLALCRPTLCHILSRHSLYSLKKSCSFLQICGLSFLYGRTVIITKHNKYLLLYTLKGLSDRIRWGFLLPKTKGVIL